MSEGIVSEGRVYCLGVSVTSSKLNFCLIENTKEWRWVSGLSLPFNEACLTTQDEAKRGDYIQPFQTWIQALVSKQDQLSCRVCYADSRAFQRLEVSPFKANLDARQFLQEKAKECFYGESEAIVSDVYPLEIDQQSFLHYVLMKGSDFEALWQLAASLQLTCLGVSTHALVLLRSFLFTFPETATVYVLESQQGFHFYVLSEHKLIFCSNFLFDVNSGVKDAFKTLKRRFYLLSESVLARYPTLSALEKAFYFFRPENATEKEQALFGALPELNWTLLQAPQLAVDIKQDDGMTAMSMLPALGAALGAFEQGPVFSVFDRPERQKEGDDAYWKKPLFLSLIFLVMWGLLSWSIRQLYSSKQTTDLVQNEEISSSLSKEKHLGLVAKKKALLQSTGTAYALLFDVLMQSLPEQMALLSLEVNEKAEVLLKTYTKESSAVHHFYRVLEPEVRDLELLSVEAFEEEGDLTHYADFKFVFKP